MAFQAVYAQILPVDDAKALSQVGTKAARKGSRARGQLNNLVLNVLLNIGARNRSDSSIAVG